jgi:hypothetical protein
VVAPASSPTATAGTLARLARASTRGVASTGTSPLPTAAAVSASVTVDRKAAARPGSSVMAPPLRRTATTRQTAAQASTPAVCNAAVRHSGP